MFHQEPIITILILYLVSKAIILSVMLIYYLFSPEKGTMPTHHRPRQKQITRLHLTLKSTRHQQPVSGRHRKTALQQTIEETFSSN
jgi:hypothetical protein